MRNSHVKDKNSPRSNRVYQTCKETCIEHVIKKIVTQPMTVTDSQRCKLRTATDDWRRRLRVLFDGDRGLMMTEGDKRETTRDRVRR